MTIIELATAVHYKIPIKVIVLDNQFLGMVRQWQELFYKRRYSSVEIGTSNPNFVQMAESMGALGIHVTDPKEVRPALERTLNHPGPVLLHVSVAKEDNVYPMVPAGQAIDQMIDMA